MLPMTSTGPRPTARLRLEPVGPANACDLWLVHADGEVARWYDGGTLTPLTPEDGDHEISCKIDGVAIGLKACFVRKA